MVKLNKFNILIIVSFLILLITLLCSLYDYDKVIINTKKANQESIEKYCQGNYKNTERKEFCENALAENSKELDFFTTFTNVVVFAGATGGIGIRSLSFVMILFVITPSLYYICRYLKSNVITNLSVRNNYKNNLFNFFCNAYKPVFILPLIGIIAVIICYLYAPNFEFLEAVKNGNLIWSSKSLNNLYLFLFLYIVNLLIHSVLYVNIALCVSRKYHNFFVSLILSFLVYLAIEVILEVGFGGILISSILKKYELMSLFNIMTMFTFNDSNGIGTCMIVPFILMIISSVIVALIYNNKEKLIISCEKENE